MLELTDCEKKYGASVVLHIPSLKLGKEIFWLQGKNGSGKTTFLRMIAGMIPFQGEILYDGVSLRRQALFYRRQVSLAEAEPVYPTFITGQELVAFYRQIRRAHKEEIKYLTDLFQMGPYLSAPVGSYSSGMTKKLSLLLALIGRSPLILLDEPLATLDVEAIQRLPELILNYHREWGCSFIFSSHQPVEHDGFSPAGKIVIADQTAQLSA
jgi:ABC-2 type transport system ATP-binding protein